MRMTRAACFANHDGFAALATSFTDLVVASGKPRRDGFLAHWPDLRKKLAWLEKLRRRELDPNTWQTGVDWLEPLNEDDTVELTDIPSSEWVAKHHDKCSKNLQIDGDPASFWHPMFVLRDKVNAVHITLSKNQEEKPLWDVIFAGQPGGPRTIPNSAPPAGGRQPLFPEFCPPFAKTDVYTLRLEHLPSLAEGREPKFDTTYRFRPKLNIPKVIESVETAAVGDWKAKQESELEKILGPPPRPISGAYDTKTSTETNGEALVPVGRLDIAEVDPADGLPRTIRAKSKRMQLMEWKTVLAAKTRENVKKRMRGEPVIDELAGLQDMPEFIAKSAAPAPLQLTLAILSRTWTTGAGPNSALGCPHDAASRRSAVTRFNSCSADFL